MRLFARHCLLSWLFCWCLSSVAATANDDVLVLSSLPEAYDRGVMATLQRELRASDGSASARIERIELPDEPDAQRVRGNVARILGLRPWKLIVTTDSWTSLLVQQSGTRVPLLFRVADQPTLLCLVNSLRHPGTNATGFTSATWSEGKMAETLQLGYPSLDQLVLITEGQDLAELADCPRPMPVPACRAGYVDSETEQQALLFSFTSPVRLKQASQRLRHPVRILRLCSDEDAGRLARWLPVNTSRGAPTVGVIVLYHGLLYRNGEALVSQLYQLRLPAIYASRNFLPMGALMAMSPVREPPGEARGIELAGRILAGELPADIPVQRPEGVELIVNLKAARELGMPPSKALLRAADRLIR